MKLTSYTLIAAAILGLSACKQQTPQATEAASAPAATTETGSDTVKIGLAAPLTGNIAHLGKDVEYGAQMAIEEVNAEGGLDLGGSKKKVVLVAEDDQADPKNATTVAQRFVDQKIAGVVGHLTSGTSIPASKIYNDAGIPQISPSATALAYTAQGFKTAFRLTANDGQQGQVLAQYAVGKLNAKKIAIVDDRTAYGQGLADEFEKAAKAAGAEIVKREFTTNQETDFNSILTNIKGAKPDLIFFGGMDAQSAPLKKQSKKLGLTAIVMGADGTKSPEFLKLAGADAEGTYGSSAGQSVDQMPGGLEFKEKFKTKYGVEVQVYAPYSYDATKLMLAAMKQAGSADPAKYLPVLAKIESKGLTGPIQFDDKGDVKNAAVGVYVVKNGKWELAEMVGGAK
ncbi:branched-chain amino acid ABC transporter substrate-binding protein [Chitinibacter bivalviorum]|uniref:Branched-chain amino acid ABC transporter substrate-binding protein n=1 Tax=Chitinibacter bivalviorum TaxID=2739434 RepID=A0A7H9BF25_9NEIS|nr:branched-chain amino acid ABC transporter substrate-binding protein [Chitinibacter bivalviorum]QLG87219.1 branched-chain amino acid ABC transporter substrate-binding protein [Chitinibacter bivalviorum]